MKKIVLSIALVLALGFGANAQIGLSDAFFNDWAQSDMLRDGGLGLMLPTLPGDHGLGGDVPGAPLGSGLIILSALGAGYAYRKRKDYK